MPKKELMSWNPGQKRWEKMSKGRRVFVTVTDLGFTRDQPGVREASYTKANEWWTNKLAEINQEQQPHAAVLDQLTAKLDYTKRHGHTEEAEALAERIDQIKEIPADDEAAVKVLANESKEAAMV